MHLIDQWHRGEACMLSTYTLVDENADIPSWVFSSNLLASRCLPIFLPLQHLLMEYSWLHQSTQMCVPKYHDAMNVVLDLQRDLHANDFALCEEYTFGIRTFLLAFFLKEREREWPFAQCRGSLPAFFF